MQMDGYSDENEHGLYTSYLHIMKPPSKMNDDHDSRSALENPQHHTKKNVR